MITALIVHPEVQRLRLECETLRDRLAQAIFDYEQLRFVIVPNLQADYQLKVGRYEYELFCAHLEEKRLRRTITLLQVAINRCESITPVQVAEQLTTEYAAWEFTLLQMAEELRSAKARMSHAMTKEESEELHRLYRTLARRLHPDVNPGQGEYDQHLWQWAEDAYEQGNLRDLRALIAMIGPVSGEMVLPPAAGVPVLDQWRRHAEGLRQQIQSQQDSITALEHDFPCSEREHLADAGWVAAQRVQNLTELQVVQGVIKSCEQLVAQLWVSVAHE